MEVKGGDRNKGFVMLYEMLGTATLIIALNFGSQYFTPIAVGLALYANIIYLGTVSGGHFNPAVTMAVLTRLGTENLGSNIFFSFFIIFAQVLGAALGVLFCFIMTKRSEQELMIHPKIPTLCPANNIADPTLLCDGNGVFGHFFLTEVVVTFVFTSVILGFKFDNLSDDHVVAARSIGVTLFAMILLSAEISGGCLNPAIGLVQSIFQHLVVNSYPVTYGLPTTKTSLNPLWVYLTAPTFGGVLAGLFSHFNASVLAKQNNAAKSQKQSIHPAAASSQDMIHQLSNENSIHDVLNEATLLQAQNQK